MSGSPTPDELLAEALAIEEQEWAGAFDYIAARISALAAAGDIPGLKRCYAVAVKWEELQRRKIQ